MRPEDPQPYCPECDEVLQPEAIDRRNFIRVVGGIAAAGVAAGTVPATLAQTTTAKAPDKAAKPAEALIRELYEGLNDTQKKDVVHEWDYRANRAMPNRMAMVNAAIGRQIGQVYTNPQQELLQRIFKAICSDEQGYKALSRNGTFDGSQSFQRIGADIYGEPADGKKFALVFTGHHLTVRCDGNSEEGAAFGGPMYYGHSPNGYSDRNVFNFQTKGVLRIFDSFNDEQRKKAVVKGTPGEHEPSVRFRKEHPGLGTKDLTKDQQELVKKVMRDIMAPYRKEDADEVMEIIKANGGMQKIHLAFYEDRQVNDKEPWHFWRLEGPGFVWNYRVLPHVHTYVNISSKL